MNKLIGILVLVLLFGIPALAQAQRMSPDDQARFSSYYSRWMQDRDTNNRDDMISVEQRMQDLMNKYAIPPDTPYGEVAAQNTVPRYDRDDRGYLGRWEGRLSADDQKKFNKEYSEWQEERREGDSKGIAKHEGKMQEIMARYNIPPNTPFDAIATANGYSHYDYHQFVGRLSPDDQKKFDKEYNEWLEERREGDRNGVAKREGKMEEIMARYDIPRDVPYDVIASGASRY